MEKNETLLAQSTGSCLARRPGNENGGWTHRPRAEGSANPRSTCRSGKGEFNPNLLGAIDSTGVVTTPTEERRLGCSQVKEHLQATGNSRRLAEQLGELRRSGRRRRRVFAVAKEAGSRRRPTDCERHRLGEGEGAPTGIADLPNLRERSDSCAERDEAGGHIGSTLGEPFLSSAGSRSLPPNKSP